MQEVANKILVEMKKEVPIVFDDINILKP